MKNDDERVIIREFLGEEISPIPQQKTNVRKMFQAIRKKQIRRAEAKMRRTRILRQRLRSKE